MSTDISVSKDTQPSTDAMLLGAVYNKDVDPAKLRELLAVRSAWRAEEAATAFNAAVVRFQQAAAIIAKGDVANNRAYARIDRIWREVRPLLRECGLAVTWESVKTLNEVCILDGHLRHAQGHAQPLHHEIPLPDKITGQNACQRAGSGETYAKRYATIAALGIQTGEDDDGNAGGAVVTDDQAEWLREAIAYTRSDMAAFCAWGGCKSLESFPAAKFTEAQSMLKRKGAK